MGSGRQGCAADRLDPHFQRALLTMRSQAQSEELRPTPQLRLLARTCASEGSRGIAAGLEASHSTRSAPCQPRGLRPAESRSRARVSAGHTEPRDQPFRRAFSSSLASTVARCVQNLTRRLALSGWGTTTSVRLRPPAEEGHFGHRLRGGAPCSASSTPSSSSSPTQMLAAMLRHCQAFERAVALSHDSGALTRRYADALFELQYLAWRAAPVPIAICCVCASR